MKDKIEKWEKQKKEKKKKNKSQGMRARVSEFIYYFFVFYGADYIF
jgi:hypothetical protein